MKDLKSKHEPPQLKERSSTANHLLGAFDAIRPRADRHHALIEGIPQWGGKCLYPRVLNMTSTQQFKQKPSWKQYQALSSTHCR